MIPPELADAIERHPLAYLITVGGDARAHVAPVTPAVDGGRLRVTALGQRSRAILAANPALTLLCPPPDALGHSLIVDGTGELHGDDLTVTPARAVLHRPAVEPSADTQGCQADCIELVTCNR